MVRFVSRPLAVALASLVMLAGCGQQDFKNESEIKYERIVEGMTDAEVEAVLGMGAAVDSGSEEMPSDLRTVLGRRRNEKLEVRKYDAKHFDIWVVFSEGKVYMKVTSDHDG
jgi:hypothetical protein